MPGGNKKSKKTAKSKKVSLTVKVAKTKKPTKPRTKKKTVITKRASSAVSSVKTKKPAIPAIKENYPIEARIISEKVERDKRLIMWSGVTFFMLLILVVWLFQTRQVINNTHLSRDSQEVLSSWDELSDDFSKRMIEMKDDLEYLNRATASATKPDIIKEELEPRLRELFASSSEILTDNMLKATSSNTRLDENDLDAVKDRLKKQLEIAELKKKLEELEEEIN